MSKMSFLCERLSFQKLLHELFEERGFVFTGELDSIVCRVCGFETRGTLSLDHIQFMHKLYNRECEMVSYKPEQYEKYAKAKLCVNNYSSKRKLIRETEDLMLFTFNSWPKRLPPVEKLVAAGFYYTGNSDEVACIECKIVLHDWETADDPFIEHEKASPNCLLVKIQKVNRTL